MIPKHPVFPGRVRRISPGFGWVDHRLVSPRSGDLNFGSHPTAFVIAQVWNR